MEVDELGREIELSEYMDRLVPLCPNCHSLAYTARPPLSIEEINALIS
jgi:predicted HNH restriction endonuclease